MPHTIEIEHLKATITVTKTSVGALKVDLAILGDRIDRITISRPVAEALRAYFKAGN